jgi:hypothetical protein
MQSAQSIQDLIVHSDQQHAVVHACIERPVTHQEELYMLKLASKSRFATAHGVGVYLHPKNWPKTQRLRSAGHRLIMVASARMTDPYKLEKFKQVLR